MIRYLAGEFQYEVVYTIAELEHALGVILGADVVAAMKTSTIGLPQICNQAAIKCFVCTTLTDEEISAEECIKAAMYDLHSVGYFNFKKDSGLQIIQK